jgi:hypothetical protein
MSTPSASAARSAPADPELQAVQYAFEAAFQRFREASDDDGRMAELSNMLHHLYRLRELCYERHGKKAYFATEKAPRSSGRRGRHAGRGALTPIDYSESRRPP